MRCSMGRSSLRNMSIRRRLTHGRDGSFQLLSVWRIFLCSLSTFWIHKKNKIPCLCSDFLYTRTKITIDIARRFVDGLEFVQVCQIFKADRRRSACVPDCRACRFGRVAVRKFRSGNTILPYFFHRISVGSAKVGRNRRLPLAHRRRVKSLQDRLRPSPTVKWRTGT